ncbi:acetolactate synthase large subunit, partial [PVC group bacterium]|nr:acetolactate synthase large subunit [PVC group bacterium]
FIKYAESYGAYGCCIEKAEDLISKMQQCMDMGGVHLIEVFVDYSENERILTQELPELTKKYSF